MSLTCAINHITVLPYCEIRERQTMGHRMVGSSALQSVFFFKPWGRSPTWGIQMGSSEMSST